MTDIILSVFVVVAWTVGALALPRLRGRRLLSMTDSDRRIERALVLKAIAEYRAKRPS